MKYSFRMHFLGEEENIYLTGTFNLLEFSIHLPIAVIRRNNVWNMVTKEGKWQ